MQGVMHLRTRRKVSNTLDVDLFKEHKILDKGFVRVVDYMGDDSSVVQAARVSYGHGTRKKRADAGLIDYLMRHDHTTPFEMCVIKFHIKAPIFVARQWMRHRMASINEKSARYSLLEYDSYEPEVADVAHQSPTRKQCRGESADSELGTDVLNKIKQNADSAYSQYSSMLSAGVARELSRVTLPVSFYTEWYWKIDLHNLFRFLKLRLSEGAQLEIRRYAEVMATIVEKWVPDSYASFARHNLRSQSFSEREIVILRTAMEQSAITQDTSGMSGSEWSEFMNKLSIDTHEH